jgi:nitrite reductase (NADH) small subunit/3-phenylpropionate/trans-cinnamate dioxygenase ferredoxin subunit
MSEFQTVCRVADLVEGEGRTVEVGGKLIAVFRTEGQYYAIDDICPHMGASLSGGWVEKGVVTCPWHAWRFRLTDGVWADYPKGKVQVGCYPIRVVNDEVQVQVPPAAAT